MIERLCKDCHKLFRQYLTTQSRCRDCTLKTTKPIPKRGKRAKLYETWRDMVAIPYLTKRYGYVCSQRGCTVTTNLDVDHIKKRSTHPELKFDVKNVRFLCRRHHQEVTNKIKWSKSNV